MTLAAVVQYAGQTQGLRRQPHRSGQADAGVLRADQGFSCSRKRAGFADPPCPLRAALSRQRCPWARVKDASHAAASTVVRTLGRNSVTLSCSSRDTSLFSLQWSLCVSPPACRFPTGCYGSWHGTGVPSTSLRSYLLS